MAGQDQAIPPKSASQFQVSPLVPVDANAQSSSSPPSQGQQGNSISAIDAPSDTSADAGTSLLRNIFEDKTKVIEATQAAMKANNAIDDQASTQTMKLYDGSMEAYQNLQKISRWSIGGDSGIADILGLFDKSWNADYQQTVIKANSATATQIADRAGIMKQINDRVPALAKLSSDLSATAFDVFSKQRGLEQKDRELNISALHAKIDLEQEGRAELANNVERLSGTEAQKQLALAKQGKGDFVGAAGLLEKHLRDEAAAEASLSQLQLNIKEGREDLADKELRRFAGYLPATQLQGMVAQAQKSNNPYITITVDKKGNTVNLPVPIAQEALAKNVKQEQDLRQQLAAQTAADADMPQKMNQVVGTAASLATLDPRAGYELQTIQNVLQNVDMKDVNSVRNGVAALDASQKRLDAVATEVAKTYPSSEAQAAIRNYAATGTFNDQGGRAVVGDVVGSPSTTQVAKYRDAFNVINRAVANQIQAQQGGGMSWLSTGKQMDDAAIMALLTQNKEKLKDSEIVKRVLADPTTNSQIIQAVTNTIQPQALISSIKSLAVEKGADPVWNRLLSNPQSWSSNGGLDANKLVAELEQQSVLTGYKTNFNSQFQTRLQKYGMQADTLTSKDPSYTVNDRALEASVFGGKPHQAIVGGLARTFKVLSDKAHAEMQKRIQMDVSGQTRQMAFQDEQTGSDPMAGFSPLTQLGANKAGGRAQGATIPSATGAPLSDMQIRAMFGGQ